MDLGELLRRLAVSIPCRCLQQDRSCLDHQPVDHSHNQEGGTCTGHTQSWQNSSILIIAFRTFIASLLKYKHKHILDNQMK